MSAAAESPHRRRGALLVGIAVAGGVFTALQSRINGQLGLELNSGALAAVISFGSGLVLLILLAAILPSGRAGVTRLWRGVRGREIPWWLLIGGAGGAFTVGMQGAVVGIIGTALFTVGMVAGQTLSGLIVDRVGYGPAGVTAVTIPRVIGVVLALAAVAVSLTGGTMSQVPLWMLVLPVFVGVGVAWQQATNGRLQRRTESGLAATLMNFIVGTALLVLLALIQVPQTDVAPLPASPWLYVGGSIGVAYIFAAAVLAPRIGVLLLSLGSVLGMLIGSLVLDLVWPPAVPPSPIRSAITVLIASAGVVVAVLGGARRR